MKTAWFMASKIRRLFKMPEEEIAEFQAQGFFELDEAVFGGLQGNRHKNKKIPNSPGGNGIDKTWVLGIVERGGLSNTSARRLILTIGYVICLDKHLLYNYQIVLSLSLTGSSTINSAPSTLLPKAAILP